MRYRASYEFEAPHQNAALQKVMTSFSLAEIDAEQVELHELNGQGEFFRYPFTRELTQFLSEKYDANPD